MYLTPPVSRFPNLEVPPVAKKVDGWMARDGRVYKTEHEANLVDTTAGLMEACERANIAPKKFLQAVNDLHVEIQDYLVLRYDGPRVRAILSEPDDESDAERETETTSGEEQSEEARSASVDPADDGGGESDPAGLQNEPSSGVEPMPDVLDGAQSSDVPTEQPRAALRSGLYYARSVQRHEVMATPSIDGLT